MFYIRKPTKVEPVIIVRQATAVELHNYKNRFIIKPSADNQVLGANSSSDYKQCDRVADDMLFMRLSSDLDLDNIEYKE